MRARQLSEEEAFPVLRTASMQTNRRVGQVSQQVIDAARYADAVNRAGKLRMLSQRLVKAGALRRRDRGAAASVEIERRCRGSSQHRRLRQGLSKPTFGDLLEAAAAALERVKMLPAGRSAPGGSRRSTHGPSPARLGRAAHPPARGRGPGRPRSHVINVSGRQRMLSQRHAKSAAGRGARPQAAARARADRPRRRGLRGGARPPARDTPQQAEIRALTRPAGTPGPTSPRRRAGSAARSGRSVDASSETCSRSPSSSPACTSEACRC